MDQKERDVQRALGHMEEFRVTAMIPIKVNVRIVQRVEAVNEEDAIEKMKMIHDIIPDHELLRDALSKAKDYSSKAEFDTTADRKYTAQQLSELKSEDCGCEDSGGTF